MGCRKHKYANGGRVKEYADGGYVSNSGGSELADAALEKSKRVLKPKPLPKPEKAKRKPKRVGN
jgi:hypothetical protein